jgi:hypothetical protein
MSERVDARHALTVSIGLALDGRYVDAEKVVAQLARPNVRPLLTRYVAELHAAALDSELQAMTESATAPASTSGIDPDDVLVEAVDDALITWLTDREDIRRPGEMVLDVITDPLNRDAALAYLAEKGLIP